jgi:carbonic anhydrase
MNHACTFHRVAFRSEPPVKLDIQALRANPDIAGELVVTGLVYDVVPDLVETVVAPAALRA